MAKHEKPTAEYIDELFRHLKDDVWADAHQKFVTQDAYYRRTFPLWPQWVKRPSYYPSTPTNIIDHAVDTQLAFEPNVHRAPAGEGEIHEQRANRIEPWLSAVLRQAGRAEPYLIWKQAGKHLITYGYAVVEGPLFNPPESGEVDEETERRMDWTPVRIHVPHPSRVLLHPFEKIPKEAIKYYKAFAKDLEEITARKRANRRAEVDLYSRAGQKAFDLIDVVEYWTRYYHCLKLRDGQMLFREPNTWGYVPFKHAYSGWGMEPTDLEKMNPSYLTVGILEPVKDSILLQAQVISGLRQIMVNAAFPHFGTTQDPQEVAQQLAADGILSGRKEDYWWADNPEFPRDMMQVLLAVERDIELGTYARVITGLRPEGVSTVGQQAILSTAASRKFTPIAMHLAELASLVASDILRLTEVISETTGISITADGFTIKPEDIEGQYHVNVTFEVIDPVLNLQQRELGMREVAMDLKSHQTYRERDARIENETEERKRLLKEKIRRSPAVQNYLGQQIIKEMGLEDLLKSINNILNEVEGRQEAPSEQGGNIPLTPGGVPTSNPPMPGSPEAARQALRSLREPLTPDVVKPKRLG